MDPETPSEEKSVSPVESSLEIKPRREFPWRRIGLGLLFVLVTVVVFSLGYLVVLLWQDYFSNSPVSPNPYENWSVYRSGTYGLGLRYPVGWEVTGASSSLIVFQLKKEAGTAVSPRDYVDLSVSPTGKRTKNACEKDQTACSFYANGIFGERILTPESEAIFFSQGKNDFTLTLHKYGDADFSSIFDEMGKSLRFVSN